jgi:hypothetical protein
MAHRTPTNWPHYVYLLSAFLLVFAAGMTVSDWRHGDPVSWGVIVLWGVIVISVFAIGFMLYRLRAGPRSNA